MNYNIWFTSDTHYHHKNIIRGISNWDDKSGCRDFASMQGHNETLIEGINKHVMQGDVLYHLGDWSFGGIDKIWEFRKRLVCNNIHLILGNHDHHIKKNKVLPNVTQNITFEGSTIRSFIDGNDGSVVVKARELFNSVSEKKELKIKGVGIITLCHYAMRVWRDSHKGTYQLYGHSHGVLPTIGRQLDVGVETAINHYGYYRPYSLKDIITAMKEIKPHHQNSNKGD